MNLTINVVEDWLGQFKLYKPEHTLVKYVAQREDWFMPQNR